MGRGRPKILSEQHEQRCVEVLSHPALSLRDCLDALRKEIPRLSYSTLNRILESNRDRGGELAVLRPRRSVSVRPARDAVDQPGTVISEHKRPVGKPRTFSDEQEAEIRRIIEIKGSVSRALKLLSVDNRFPKAGETKIREIARGVTGANRYRRIDWDETGSLSDFGALCRQRGIRYTAAMRKVEYVFSEPRAKLTVTEILALVPRVKGSSRSAIRRALSLLGDEGILKVEGSSNRCLYTWPPDLPLGCVPENRPGGG